MSWSGIWIIARVPRESEAAVAKKIGDALAQPLSPEITHAIETIERNPEVLVIKDAEHVNTYYNPFLAACTPFPVMKEFDLLDFRRDIFRFFGFDRIAPTGALYYALGPERASRLPGRFGTMFVPASEAPKLREQLRALVEADPEKTLERARRIIRFGNNEPETDAPELLRALPDAFDEAARAGMGLVAWGTNP